MNLKGAISRLPIRGRAVSVGAEWASLSLWTTVLAFLSAGVVASAQPNSATDYIVFGETKVVLKGGVQVMSGAVGTNGILKAKAVHFLDESTLVGSDLIVKSSQGSGRLYFNSSNLDASSILTGSIITPIDIPVLTIPEVPVPSVGDLDLVVLSGETLVIEPGVFRTIRVDRGGHLRLASGSYQTDRMFLQNIWGGSGPAKMTCDGVCVISAARNVKIGNESEVWGPGITVRVAGSAAVKIGKFTVFRGTLIAPNASIKVGNGVRLIGSLLGKKVIVGKGATLLVEGPISTAVDQLESFATNAFSGYPPAQPEPGEDVPGGVSVDDPAIFAALPAEPPFFVFGIGSLYALGYGQDSAANSSIHDFASDVIDRLAASPYIVPPLTIEPLRAALETVQFHVEGREAGCVSPSGGNDAQVFLPSPCLNTTTIAKECSSSRPVGLALVNDDAYHIVVKNQVAKEVKRRTDSATNTIVHELLHTIVDSSDCYFHLPCLPPLGDGAHLMVFKLAEDLIDTADSGPFCSYNSPSSIPSRLLEHPEWVACYALFGLDEACNEPMPGVCGDGAIDLGEECDGSNLNGRYCNGLVPGSVGGRLSCNSNCTFNTSNCVFELSGSCQGVISGDHGGQYNFLITDGVVSGSTSLGEIFGFFSVQGVLTASTIDGPYGDCSWQHTLLDIEGTQAGTWECPPQEDPPEENPPSGEFSGTCLPNCQKLPGSIGCS